MALPNIQYARTSDGASIAYYAMGKGPAVVILFPYHVNHLTLNWQVPLHRKAFEYFARCFTVINLDFRGAGVSERPVPFLSLNTFVEDLRAVMACLRIERVALCAMGDAALVAFQFASLWPDSVSNLVLIGAGESEANRRVLSMRHLNPKLEAHLRGALLGGLDDEVNASALSAVAREALSSNSLRHWEQLLLENQLSSIASRIAVPALCFQASEDELVTVEDAQRLADQMADATLKMVPGRSGMDIWRDRATMQSMAQFFAKGFGVENEVVLAFRRRRPRLTDYPAGLSQREAEVLRLVAAGRTNQQISESLFISLNTVNFHLRNIFNKTGTSNRTEAASFAHRHGISASLK